MSLQKTPLHAIILTNHIKRRYINNHSNHSKTIDVDSLMKRDNLLSLTVSPNSNTKDKISFQVIEGRTK